MKISFFVELYDDMIGESFNIRDYLACRLCIFVQQNGEKNEVCNSTFHDALLLGMGDILLELKENNTSFSKVIETFENAMKYTLKKTGNLLNIKAYSEYDGTTEIVFQGEFEDFLIAFFKEYERYFKGILQKDSNTIQHKSVEMMERQLKVYKALINRY
ncbi:hypothetical protein [Lysinibacillus halotolerans]|uniref:Uncharacterized protein n=1 Tax=Lysinibacillus halotolerans TaxID=1368476 RepID=A0A3M8HG15_9BACI|nr:hypothetical protein [Lysinibacillus halotolerans]RND01343.1 hypothetical protein EC501_01675 [Lysinibacillus halotolerans]